MIKNKEELKKQLIAEIIRTKGFKTIACNALKVNPRTFRSWMTEDDEFRQAVSDAVEIAREYRDDVAEQKLFGQVEAGDTTAIIFYCKTRLKNRGYSEKTLPQEIKQSALEQKTLPQSDIDIEAKVPAAIRKKITARKTYLIKLLKKQGKYTPELSMQVKIVAQLMVRTDLLEAQVFNEKHKATHIEFSREGNERETASPKEKLYLDYLRQSQKALQALGMNTDSRERRTDNDGFSDFMERFNKEDEE